MYSKLILILSSTFTGMINATNFRGLGGSSKCCLNDVCVEKNKWAYLLDNVIKCKCLYNDYEQKYQWGECYCTDTKPTWTTDTTKPTWTTDTTKPTWTTDTTKPTWTTDTTKPTWTTDTCCWEGKCVYENEWLDDGYLNCQCVYDNGEYKWKNCKNACC